MDKCLECGKEFEQCRSKNKKFCSSKCCQKNWRKNNLERSRTTGRKCYHKYREKNILHNKKLKKIYLKKFNEYKLSKGCFFCHYSLCAAALEFHHLYGKDFRIREYNFYTMNEKTKKELEKCILLCANCHREEHDRLRKLSAGNLLP